MRPAFLLSDVRSIDEPESKLFSDQQKPDLTSNTNDRSIHSAAISTPKFGYDSLIRITRFIEDLELDFVIIFRFCKFAGT
jgi:hypothetical protein